VVYPQLFSYDQDQLRSLKEYAGTCEKMHIPKILPPKLRKAWVYHQYDCGSAKELPPHFLSEPPLMHPTGASFAWLLRRHLSEFGPTAFRFLHILELRELAALGVAMPEAQVILAGIDQAQLRSLSAGARLLVGKDTVGWVDTESEAGRNLLLFSAAEFRAALAARHLVMEDKPLSCTSQAYGVCLRKTDPTLEYMGLGLSATGLMFLLVWGLVQVRQRLIERLRFAQERQFLLQALTHELRTPAASLRLAVESLRTRIDELPDFAQSGVLRLSEDVSRLGRVLRASESLVRMEMAKDQNVEISSLAEFLRDIAEDEGVEFVGSGDCRISTNPKWLAIAVRNLVENGKRHGKPPVTLGLVVEGRRSRLFVEDRGELGFGSVRQLSQARAAKQSSGLGFGLQLVERICRSLGARLAVAPDKARFEISWKT
jgi:signal transduction histidine kinase